MSSEATIELKDDNVWEITLTEPTNNEETVKCLPEVKKFIDNNIKGYPYLEDYSGRCWYLVDKKITDSDDTDYLKNIYLEKFIGKDLLQDAKDSLTPNDGSLVIEHILTPEDKEHFENHIKDGDEIELVAKNGIDKIKVIITNIAMITIKKNEHYYVKYTLVRK